MTDSILTDKISETITNVFKKTKVFEKIEKMEFLVGTFVIISSIIGLTNVYFNYSNLNKVNKITKIFLDKEENICKTIDINHSVSIKFFENKINELEEKLSLILENQHKLLIEMNEIKNLPILTIGKADTLSKSTSVSSLLFESPDNDNDNDNDNNNNNNNNFYFQQNNLEQDNNELLDELMDECYDSIPLSNIKKNTGLTWLFK